MAKQIKIHLTTEASKYILEKTCADRNYGARPLRRARRHNLRSTPK
jgi:ATP-dependent Clp protease ATP-binding subunit ClpC